MSSCTSCESEDEALQPVFEPSHIEIDQEALSDAGKLHVSQQLRLVDSFQLIHALEFQKDWVLNKQVDPVAAVEPNAFVENWEGLLSNELDFMESPTRVPSTARR